MGWQLYLMRLRQMKNEVEIKGHESKVASDAKGIFRLPTLVKDCSSNRLCMTAENGKLRRRVQDMKRKLSRQYRLQDNFSRRSVL